MYYIFVNCIYVIITNCICPKNGKGPFLVLAIRNVKILIIKRFIRVLPSALRIACNLKISVTMC